MARIRSIKPEVRTSLVVADWPREVRYFWVLLWGYVDDHGAGVDNSRLVKADCFPLDDDLTSATIDDWLQLIADSGPLCRFEVDGHRYLHCVNWTEHQKPAHPKDSRIPPCPSHGPHENLAKSSRNSHEDFAPEQGAGSREQGAGKEEPSSGLRPDVERICNHLADRIEANGSKRPNVTAKWRETARLMLDRDGRTEAQILTAIDWCQDSTFWRGNVMSLPKLREKYDQLRLAAQSARASPVVANGHRPSTTDQRVAVGLALAEKYAQEDS